VLATASLCSVRMCIVAIVLPLYFVLHYIRSCACPPVSTGRAIRCLAGRHPSLSTPFRPRAGPLAGPARLYPVQLSSFLYRTLVHGSTGYGLHLVTWDFLFPLGNIRYLLGTPAVTFFRHWPFHRPAVIVALLYLLTSLSNGL
jgi:hypothetical protein